MRGHGHRRRGPRHDRPAPARCDRPEVRVGPVGGAAVAAVIGEEVDTIEDVYEPYLLQLGFLDRTPQGRVATERARDHLRKARLRDPAAAARQTGPTWACGTA